jgi:hypothetical protein
MKGYDWSIPAQVWAGPLIPDPDSSRFVGMSVHAKLPISEKKRSYGDGWVTIGNRELSVIITAISSS